MSETKQVPPIAVIGMSSIFPGSQDLDGFWQDILAGRDRLGPVPRTHWLVEDYYDPDPKAPDKIYVDRGGFLDPIDFDPMKWGVPPSILPATDSTQLLSLVVAERALRDAFGDRLDGVDRDRVSVMLGVTGAQKLLGEMNSRLQRPIWAHGLRQMGLSEAEIEEACDRISASYVPWQESTFPGVLGNVVAGRIANRLDLGGTNCVTDAACASAFGALHMALNELALGQSDVVICGGADTMNDPFMFECFAKTTALSKQGDCRPFDRSADGTMLGEGVAMVVLARLDDAIARGDRVYAVIRGLGSSSDGRAKSVYAPLPAGQAKALRRAYERAGYGPETVELVEAHGTGTAAGDAAEVRGLLEVFGSTGSRACALGSVKAQIGHTKAAAGAAGLIKAVLALRHGVLPPTIKVEEPNEALSDDGPFYLSAKARPWIRGSDHPRRASVSSFGFGGSNFHVTLEEHRGAGLAARLPVRDVELVTLSADDGSSLAARVKGLVAEVRRPGMLRWLAYESQRTFDARAKARLALVARDEEDLAGKLEMAVPFLLEGKSFSAPGGLEIELGEVQREPLALLFPGQGSQYLEMGAALAIAFSRAREVWDRAADVAMGDRPLHRVVFPPPSFDAKVRDEDARRLTATEWAQPGLGVASAAALAVLRALGVEAHAYAGHSFGEVTALYAAGALTSERDLVRVARERGERMAAAADVDGAMLAVSASLDAVRAVIDEARLEVVVANHNHPEQVVLSGATSAIEEAAHVLREKKLRASRLEVATAFHSPLVAPSAEPFGAFLEGIELGAMHAPVYANATAAPYEASATRATLAAQLSSPVRFVEEIEAMYAAGLRTFVEVGPGAVLTGLVSRILKGRPHRAVALDRKGVDGLGAFFGGLAKLAVAGVPLRFEALWEDERAPLDPRTIEAPKMAVKLGGANVGKPYPPAKDAVVAKAARVAVVGGAASAVALPSERAERSARQGAKAPRKTDEALLAARSLAPAVASPPLVSPPVSPPVASPPAVAPPPASAPEPMLQVFLETQRHTAEAHAAYQRAVADAHAAFLRSSEATMSAIAALLGGAPSTAVSAAMPALQPIAPSPVIAPPPVMAPPPVLAPPPQIAAPPVVAPPRVVSPPALQAPDLMPLLLAVVGEKTGYPVEMLTPSMELESDLGVDSIKRVEILAALRERAPGLPELDPAELGKLRTLSEIGAVLGRATPSSVPVLVPVPVPSVSTDLMPLLLRVVSEKTGYPVEMLTPTMELESDLGVDSIKRVEILAALRERASGLPELDPAELGKLRTLSEIGAVLGRATPSPVPVPVPVPSVSTDLMPLLLRVVSEKTGYPVEMLTPTMELESDLGVDSIKRVEILAALRERAPGLPELDPAELGKLRTLSEIAAVLGRATSSPAPAAVPSVSTDLIPLLLRVVSEKTGYPVEMLTPTMELESDLGVDSIKRVEILAALRERAPGLPELDPAELGKLRTLDQIAAVLTQSAPGPKPEPPRLPTASTPRAPVVDRAVVSLVEAPLPGLAPRGLFGARVAVLDDGDGVADALVAQLAQQGVDAYFAPSPPADADALIVLSGLGDDPSRARRAAFDAARSVASRFTERGGLFVTVQDTGGHLGLAASDRAGFAALTGLAKTAALEWPRATVRAIDIDTQGLDADTIAARIARELIDGGACPEVGLEREGVRRVPTLTTTPLPPRTTLTSPPTVLASGGARGVTARCLIALARHAGGRFLLLGRTALEDEPTFAHGHEGAALKRAVLEARRTSGVTPREIDAEVRRIEASREVRATLRALHDAGAIARYAAVDVRDAASIRRAMDESGFGAFDTLVHGAGVLADKLLVDKKPEDFERVLATKVDGLEALLEATRSESLSRVLFFSSVAARFGNAGQSDYAMANAVLDAVAAREAAARPDAVVRALAWGPWEGGMVTPELASLFASRGVSLIDLEAGADAFVREAVSSGPSSVVLGAALAAPAEERRVEARVSRRTHAYLEDHAVKDVPVVPVVLVVDWMARAARALKPELVVARVRDVAVLRGLPLPRFDEGERFELALRRVSNGHGATYAATLSDARGVCYRAEIDLVPERPAGAPPRPAPASLEARTAPLYGGCLFHGERFQVIRRLDGVGESGAAGVLVGTHAVHWNGDGWQTDPALLDGALQLAVLWTEKRLGGAALPTGLEAVHLHREGPIDGLVRGVVYAQSASSGRAVCDVVLVDEHGRPVAELRGVETHVRPGTQAQGART